MATYDIDDLPDKISEGDIILADSAFQKELKLPKGDFLFESYGAKGEGAGGSGAYCKGILTIENSLSIFLNISESSDIRLDNNLNSRIMVAGSGGGEGLWDRNGITIIDRKSGGSSGLVGKDGSYHNTASGSHKEGKGGSQTKKGDGYSGGGPGGKGYYDGGEGFYYKSGSDLIKNSGGGGSSFISGHIGCDALDEKGIHTGQPYHYSGLYFKETSIGVHQERLPKIKITVISLLNSSAIKFREKGCIIKSNVIKEFMFTFENLKKYGMSTKDISIINFSNLFSEKHYISNSSKPLALGKVFEQTLDENKIIKSIDIEGKTLVMSNGVKYYYKDFWSPVIGTEEDYIKYGMDSKSISNIPQIAWGELSNIIVLCYKENMDIEEVIIKTETEPFMIYEEFNDLIEIVVYTDDSNIENMDIHIDTNHSPLDELKDDFEIITWTNSDEKDMSLDLKAIPHGQLVFSKNDLNTVIINDISLSAKGIKIIVSFNKGITWNTFTQGEWKDISPNEKDVKAKGLNVEVLNELIKEQILNKSNTVRFAYYLEQENLEDDVFVSEINLKTRSLSSSTPTVEDIRIEYEELSIEGRLKEMEGANAINLAKLNFKASVLAQNEKYNLHDMIIDTFTDDLSVESSTVSYHAGEQKFTGRGAIVFNEELTSTYLTSIWLTSDSEGSISFEFSLDNAASWNPLEENSLEEIKNENYKSIKIKANLLSTSSELSAIAYGWI